ncbi:unnamed protein product [Rangifer tarandus platyrhynchus]|uniref:Uncharacterized protein n=2 Tax=Rangifer tarandus platyrhynchus TaxID=3082113 RepID=A0ACB0F3P8_RANTA|nr:unnamed protein product [Rangifer tarandus platyrhynchus]CAI9707565.1 unnamed protein product [Rangifer tarandus platyrhynchus]
MSGKTGLGTRADLFPHAERVHTTPAWPGHRNEQPDPLRVGSCSTTRAAPTRAATRAEAGLPKPAGHLSRHPLWSDWGPPTPTNALGPGTPSADSVEHCPGQPVAQGLHLRRRAWARLRDAPITALQAHSGDRGGGQRELKSAEGRSAVEPQACGTRQRRAAPSKGATPSSLGGVSDLGGGSHTPTITPVCRTTTRHPVSGTEQRGTKRPSELVCQEEMPTAPRGDESTLPNHTRATTLHGPEGLPQTAAGSPADPRGELSAPPGSAVTPGHKGGWCPGSPSAVLASPRVLQEGEGTVGEGT